SPVTKSSVSELPQLRRLSSGYLAYYYVLPAANRATLTRVSVSLDSRRRARFHTSRSPSFRCRAHRSARSRASPFPPRPEAEDLSERGWKLFVACASVVPAPAAEANRVFGGRKARWLCAGVIS